MNFVLRLTFWFKSRTFHISFFDPIADEAIDCGFRVTFTQAHNTAAVFRGVPSLIRCVHFGQDIGLPWVRELRRVAAGGTCSFSTTKRAALLSHCLAARRRDLAEKALTFPRLPSFLHSLPPRPTLTVLQEPCFLATCPNLADDSRVKSEVVAHCLLLTSSLRKLCLLLFSVAPLGSQDGMLHCMSFSIVLRRQTCTRAGLG